MSTGDVRDFIRTELMRDATQWNLGSFGAIAEFMRDPGEAVTMIDDAARLGAVTARGGIGFGDLSRVRLFASETAVGRGWSHRVALCLPEVDCAMSRRGVLSELGPDAEALRPQDREAVLFDMGLSALQTDICIRTADPALIAVLRAQAGRSLFEPGNPAMGAIVAAGPHRVFLARFGRCEVFQPIPPPDGRSPEGPHTHVLPKLLRSGRTHAATEPAPAGFLPCAHLVPAHPLKDAMGHPTPWDAAAHARFQSLLAAFGDPDLVALKADAIALAQSGQGPDSLPMPAGKAVRHVLRVALRQLAASGRQWPALPAWLAAFDRRGADEAADDYGHA